ncbi:MAG: hypothetical protein SGBAC_010531 [Bacillariaceae sp.]
MARNAHHQRARRLAREEAAAREEATAVSDIEQHPQEEEATDEIIGTEEPLVDDTSTDEEDVNDELEEGPEEDDGALTPALEIRNKVLRFKCRSHYEIYKQGTEKLREQKYDCIPDQFYQIMQDIKLRANSMGWNHEGGIFYVAPEKGRRKIDILRNYGSISLERIQEHEMTYCSGGTRSAQDNQMLFQAIMNSMSATGRDKLTLHSDDYELGRKCTQSGLCLFMVLIRESYLDYRRLIQGKYKVDIQNSVKEMASNKAVSQKNNRGLEPNSLLPKPTKNPKRVHSVGNGTAEKRTKLSNRLIEKENKATKANTMTAPATGRTRSTSIAQPPTWFLPAMTDLLKPIQVHLKTITKQQSSIEARLMGVETLQKREESRLFNLERRLHNIEFPQSSILSQLNKMESQSNDMSDQLLEVKNFQHSMSYRLSNVIARQLNGVLGKSTKLTDPVYECWNPKWEVANASPSTVEALFEMTELEINSFLQHYDILPVPTSMEEKRRIIQRFLGIPELDVDESLLNF